MQSKYQSLFANHGISALAFPTSPMTARNIGDDTVVNLNDTQVPTFETYIRNTDLASNLAAPGISLPCSAAGELPVGFELDGLPNKDDALLRLSAAIDTVARPA